MKSDILDFLDKKFAKTVKKKPKKKKDKSEAKQAGQVEGKEAEQSSIFEAINKADKGQKISGDTLYHELVKDSESSKKGGIKALNDFHMQNDQTYDNMKDKIFFIG